MLDLIHEFKALIAELSSAELPYALWGGLAMAVYGAPRATIDIDLLVSEEAFDGVRSVALGLGYKLETNLTEPAGGQLTITRMTKFDSESDDYLMLDLLHVSAPLKPFWTQRRAVQSELGEIWVVSREGLIDLKMLRGSKQDQADIERLRTLDDES